MPEVAGLYCEVRIIGLVHNVRFIILRSPEELENRELPYL